ncbi:3-keto-disaccharide hydrolase [Sphingobacterium sp. SYP-B4668]|uniref:3-keto-disaccharide hydrolase n=1 Tax=Sphingobacterium sp. SYP-B4668 TaxID=2996035 RepID=UPI0022DE41EE|nr:DUF1080 domain-containing protein [Sphingobacterium sp. SYP-B4668]
MKKTIICTSLVVGILSLAAIPRVIKTDNSLPNVQSSKGPWQDLIAGNSLQQWHCYLEASEIGWTVQNGILSTPGNKGDIVTNKEYHNFELELEWKIEKQGNSGIFIYVVEHPDNKYIYQTGPEFQIIDNLNYPFQLTEQQKTGALSDVISPKNAIPKPVGQWNKVRIVAHDNKVQHWLNNKLILNYTIGSDELATHISASKFANLPYAKTNKGRIGLQDHGDPVYYRNIRIREIN